MLLDSSKKYWIGRSSALPRLREGGWVRGWTRGFAGCSQPGLGGQAWRGSCFPCGRCSRECGKIWDSSLRAPGCAAGEGSAAPWEQPAAVGRAEPSPCEPCPAGTPHGTASSAATRRPESAAGLAGGSAPSPRSPRRVLGPEAAAPARLVPAGPARLVPAGGAEPGLRGRPGPARRRNRGRCRC